MINDNFLLDNIFIILMLILMILDSQGPTFLYCHPRPDRGSRSDLWTPPFLCVIPVYCHPRGGGDGNLVQFGSWIPGQARNDNSPTRFRSPYLAYCLVLIACFSCLSFSPQCV